MVHRLIERIVVRHEPATGGHTMEIFGNLVELLAVADSKNAAAYSAAACSLNLVAGACNQRLSLVEMNDIPFRLTG